MSGETAQPSSPVLEARGISKSYGAVEALKNVDLQLFAGEVLGLVGDNGAGKTTLVKCLSGVHKPDDGQVVIDGVERHGPDRRESLARSASRPSTRTCLSSTRWT